MSPETLRIRAPGRINLIGEHTDYNHGWVMPAAIELAATATLRPRQDRRIRLASAQYPDAVEFDLHQSASSWPPHWSNGPRRVAMYLARAQGVARLPGADLWIESDVPIGAGLASSAAVEVAVAMALVAAAGATLAPTELAQLCQLASHDFGGARCGIMDFFISAQGRANQIALLDTRDLSVRWLAWPAEAALVVCDTGVRHDHASGDYNRRREECEAAVQALRRRLPMLPSLRELDPHDIERNADVLDPVLLARCRHVLSENARVLAAAAALEDRDFAALGTLLDASHRSLRDDYQVSCPELDRLAEQCRRQPGVYGARMMGGGFGGCVLALAEAEQAEALQARLGCPAWVLHPAAGAIRI